MSSSSSPKPKWFDVLNNGATEVENYPLHLYKQGSTMVDIEGAMLNIVHDWHNYMESFLGTLQRHEISMYEYFWGRFLNAVPGYMPEAETFLRNAVCSIFEAWKCLGICLYKKGDFSDAKIWLRAFLGKKGPEKEALHYLSCIAVYLAQHAENPSEHLDEAMKHCWAAVDLDEKDGMSWYYLGVAYHHWFFLTGEGDLNSLVESLSAYHKAYADETKNFLYPNLIYETATIFTFLGEYDTALARYSQCVPTTPGATEDMWRIIRLLDRLDELVKVDRVTTTREFFENYTDIKDNFLEVSPAYEEVDNDDLVEGLNRDRALVARVLHRVSNETSYPLYYILSDFNADRLVLTVHGLDERAINKGDLLVLLHPYCKKVNFVWGKEYKFNSLHLDERVLVRVNGEMPPAIFEFQSSIRKKDRVIADPFF